MNILVKVFYISILFLLSGCLSTHKINYQLENVPSVITLIDNRSNDEKVGTGAWDMLDEPIMYYGDKRISIDRIELLQNILNSNLVASIKPIEVLIESFIIVDYFPKSNGAVSAAAAGSISSIVASSIPFDSKAKDRIIIKVIGSVHGKTFESVYSETYIGNLVTTRVTDDILSKALLNGAKKASEVIKATIETVQQKAN